MGKPIEEMSREELTKALGHVHKRRAQLAAALVEAGETPELLAQRDAADEAYVLVTAEILKRK